MYWCPPPPPPPPDVADEGEDSPGTSPAGNSSPLAEECVGLSIPFGGFIRFSFCRRLQNHTRTTSFSMHRLSARVEISSLVGLQLTRNAFSSATRTDVSIEVRFLRRRPIVSGVAIVLERAAGLKMRLRKREESV
uniref:Uncharacterized protein n=1 Tax=Anopheles coluzzii TaxID=1518534 RepID=A0A8W7PIP7_ANOCL